MNILAVAAEYHGVRVDQMLGTAKKAAARNAQGDAAAVLRDQGLMARQISLVLGISGAMVNQRIAEARRRSAAQSKADASRQDARPVFEIHWMRHCAELEGVAA